MPPAPRTAAEQVRIESATGVDLTLDIAGPGSRSYAFIIDWHVRLLLACAWLLIAIYALHLSVHAGAESRDLLLSGIPAAAIYFLYHPIVEVAMRGRSPGKRMAGLAIVDRHGGTPGTTALLIRNLFRVVDCLPAFYMVGLVSCFFTVHRVRIGDIAAGTLLVAEDEDARRSLSRIETLASSSDLPLAALELLDQVIERWPALDAERRAQIARSLLARIAPDEGDAAGALGEEALLERLTALRAGRLRGRADV